MSSSSQTRQTRQIRLAFAAFGLAAAIAGTSRVASAKHHMGHGDGGTEADDEPGSGAAPMGSAAPDDGDDSDDDGGAPVVVDRTAAQTAHRDQVVAKEKALVEGAIHASGQRLTARERQEIGMHWRHVMRLLRIRDLAEDDKDTATVTRVDAVLDRAEKSFAKRMGGLHGASSGGGAP